MHVPSSRTRTGCPGLWEPAGYHCADLRDVIRCLLLFISVGFICLFLGISDQNRVNTKASKAGGWGGALKMRVGGKVRKMVLGATVSWALLL